MEKVQVLMSTYNGEKYIIEQVKSILTQNNIKVNILVRDDCSTDSTKKIIKDLGLRVIEGKNLKPAKSFMELIRNSDDNYKFYALSDQDDFWLPEKLNRAIKRITEFEQTKPIVYFSTKKITDEKLNFLYLLKESEEISLESAMIKNIATGCTIVFNNKMMQYLKQYIPKDIEMHDAWIYRLCLALDGIAIYDEESFIFYRQHCNNVVGAAETMQKKIIRRVNSLINPKRYRESMAKEIINGYKKYLTNDNYKILNDFANYRNSIKSKLNLLFNKKIKLNNIKENIIFKIAVVLNRV